MKRWNMWKRLGLVLSVLWVTGGGVFSLIYTSDQMMKASVTMNVSCVAASDIRHDHVSPGGVAENRRYEAEQKRCEAKSTHYWQALRKDLWVYVAVAAFAPPIIAWLLALLSIRMVRWILAGRT